MGRRPVSCMSFARLLSAMVSPLKTTRTRRGESSKYSVCGLSAPVSKLNVPVLWLPKGPVPIVRVIVSLLSVGRELPYCTRCSGEPTVPLLREAYTDPSPRCVFREYFIENRRESWRRCAIWRRDNRGDRGATGEEKMLRETGTTE